MKILSLYLLLYKLSNNYLKFQSSFMKIIKGIFVGLFYLIEYIFIFFFQIHYLYILILNRSRAIKKISKKKIQKENKYVKFFKKLYYYRRMYWGLTVAYMHVFLRKIREFKNYIIYLINTRLIWGYKVLKWRIRIYSFFYFYWYNYRLFSYYRRFKRKIKKFVMLIVYLSLYIKIKIKIKPKMKLKKWN